MTETHTPPSAGAADAQVLPSVQLARLPLPKYPNCPAIPYWALANGQPDPERIAATLASLQARTVEATPAYDGLSIDYTIANQTQTAYQFLYGIQAPPAPDLPLEAPEQSTLSWTLYGGMYPDSQDLVLPFASLLRDRDAATKEFWPTIANFGLPYNLLVLEKVDQPRAERLAAEFGDAWPREEMEALRAAGLLYMIDMTILASLPPLQQGSETRFTPGTVTVLQQHPQTKALTPIGISLSTAAGPSDPYTPKDNAWLYALQAAKTSITVWGIWIGHVYHWHIVTAAMQMTMFNTLPDGHPLWPLLGPQSDSLIEFNTALLVAMLPTKPPTPFWNVISPPTPVGPPNLTAGDVPLVALLNLFANGRGFFEDDPHAELESRGLKPKDFNNWDAYPLVRFLLEIWDITEEFVSAVVNRIYPTDKDVADDEDLKAWIKASGDTAGGNVQGLHALNTRNDLIALLTSILYRVNVHGAGSLTPTVHPALSFVANFPPCLQDAAIPKPSDPVSPTDLLKKLPHTRSIGGMTTFYYTFVYSQPYESLIPRGGITADAYFPGPPKSPCNLALFRFRERIHDFVDEYTAHWNQELTRIRGYDRGIPGYATNQYLEWPRSIEI